MNTTVPVWFAISIVVGSAMASAALAFNDPALTFLTPSVRFVLFVLNVGLTTLAAALNIKKPSE